ncbi:SDR family oxidoreductase [Amycolatopsis sp. H20-H5]|uniref:SDR family oxidoreductase n=1 Tax=Amycolatopsis sp. H20-H5 TaxID=3046309 RepID=UPI002DB576E0|nr:SDR family oxidoreductase [Amycolatopsis sp. H20-H5]MEC3975747.1 SDR family oxidoreductase [Amycolatopsis sp. H20-H5]
MRREQDGQGRRSGGRKAIALAADLADPAAVEAITPAMLGFAGRVDILVNNAGIFPFEDLWQLTFERWREIFAVNTDSQFLMTKAVMGSMKQNNWGWPCQTWSPTWRARARSSA